MSSLRRRISRGLASVVVRFGALFVPAAFRREWLDEWQAELWHELHAGLEDVSLIRLSLGAVPDALATRALPTALGRESRYISPLERWNMMSQELRHAVRGLVRSPGFALVAVLTLALGIGANTTIFTLVQSVLLDPLPYPDSDRLVRVTHPVPGVGVESEWNLSTAGYFHFREHARSLEELGVYTSGDVNLTVGGAAVRVTGVGHSSVR